MVCTAFALAGGSPFQMTAGSPLPCHQLAKRLNDQLQWWVAVRVGVAMMRLSEMTRSSDLHLTPARTGLIIVAAFLLCAVLVRVITLTEAAAVRAPTAPENVARVTLDIGIADLRGSLP